MKRLFALLWLLSHVGLEAQLIPENNLPSTSTLSDNDSVRVIKNGASMKTPASVVRTIRAAQISDATVVGRNFITTATPTIIAFPQINADGTITYLDASAFLAAIGGGSSSVTIQEIDGSPLMPFNVLEVPDGSLSDQGGGVARLTFSTTGGGGGSLWGSIVGTLSSQTDLQAALDAKQPLDQDLTDIAALSTQAYGRSLLTLSSSAALLASLGAQPADPDLDDLADGSLSGSKVGSGINAANITTGTLALARGGLARDASADADGLFGILAGTSTDVDTFAEFCTALGITGTQSSATVLRGDGTLGASAGAITVTEEDASPSVSSVTEIRVTNGALIDNGSGSISLDLSGGVGGGDVISDVGVSVADQIALFAGTTGKHIQPYSGTGILNATAGVIGTVTNSAGLAAGLSDETGTGAAVFASGPTFTSPQLGAASASSVTSPIFATNAADPADTGTLRLANGENIAWENNPASTDNTLGVTAGNILTANLAFSAVTLLEGSLAVPNANDNLSFFAPTSSAQLASIVSDEVGSGRFILETNATLTTPTISGNLTFLNGYQYADAAMAALVIDTSELNNTKTVAANSTLTFSGAPATGALFGLQITNSDVAVHTITIPSSKSDALGGAARTSFLLGPGSSASIKWRYEGGATYTMWGDPFSINELTEDPTPIAADDYVMTYDASAGGHKKVKLNVLPTGAGDNISVDWCSVVDPDFTDGGDINFAATGSPATVTATVKADSVALTTDTTGNYVASITPGLGLTGTTATEAGANTVAFDVSAALSGDHTLNANEEKFGQSGLIFEGTTANAVETFFSVADPTSSDKTISFPDASGTVILSGHTFTGNVTATLGAGGTTALTITGNAVNGADIAMGSDAQGDILFYNGTDYARLAASTAGDVLATGGAGADPSWVDSAASTQTLTNKTITDTSNVLPAEIVVAASDETTALTTGTGKVTFRMPYAMTVTSVRASLTTAQGSGTVVTVDVNETGSGSILSTLLTIDNGEKTSTTAVTPPVISDATLADDAEITVDIDAVGTAPTGLKVTLLGTR